MTPLRVTHVDNYKSPMTLAEPMTAKPAASVEALALHAFESYAHAAVLLTPVEPLIVWQNAASRRLFLDHGIGQGGGRIVLPNRQHQPSFEAFLASAGVRPATWIMPGSGLEDTLIFRCRRLLQEGDAVGRVLTVHSPAEPSTTVPDIRSIFGLTPAEMKVLECLVEGMSAETLSAELNITLETARTHIRRVYNKMEVSGREQLIALTNRFRVP